jgi:hypothetical protein
MLGGGDGEREEPGEFWKRPLQNNPPNNLEMLFPEKYLDQNDLMYPLVPTRYLERGEKDKTSLGMSPGSKEIRLKLQTRIENEATLKVGKRNTLEEIVLHLLMLGGGDVDGVMKGDPLLENFGWALKATETLVFTDRYLDDNQLHALSAGIGIRKRTSDTAIKLNVKTGSGYHVHQPQGPLKPGERYPEDRSGEMTDIYRRHEVGFSLNPEASPQDIGKFLHKGTQDHDGWNIGGDEANSGLEEPIQFLELEDRMVLIGYRRKFNLQAIPKQGTGTINIEISCDHTVGCRPRDVPKDVHDEKTFKAFLKDMDSEKYKEALNVEMELEHLGAGGAQTTGVKQDTTSNINPEKAKKLWGGGQKVVPQQPQVGPVPKLPPSGYPNIRPYKKEDSQNEKFNTPSFCVFYSAHNRIIDYLKSSMKGHLDEGDLGSDRQKLETLRDKLHILGDKSKKKSQPPISVVPDSRQKEKQPSQRDSSPSIAMDGNCLYQAVINAGQLNLTVELLRQFATSLLLENEDLRQKMSRYGSNLNDLILTMCTNYQWAGDEGDLAPVVLAHYIRRNLRIVSVAEKQTYVIQAREQDGPEVVVFYADNHYETKAPLEAQGWEKWERGKKKDQGEKTQGGSGSPKVEITTTQSLPSKPELKRYKVKGSALVGPDPKKQGEHRLTSTAPVEVLEDTVVNGKVKVMYDYNTRGRLTGWMAIENLDFSQCRDWLWNK